MSLDSAQRDRLLRLYPHLRSAPEKVESEALELLLTSEEERRGAPDATGAFTRTALTQGSLLQKEYDHSIHGHAGFPLEALVVDIQRLIRFNVRYGFAGGDGALRSVVQTLKHQLPTSKIVRIHADAFAALLVPSSDVALTVELAKRVHEALVSRLSAFRDEVEHTVSQSPHEPEGPLPEVGFQVALLHLSLKDISHWQLLGPTVWAEAERALVLSKALDPFSPQRRVVDFHGQLP